MQTALPKATAPVSDAPHRLSSVWAFWSAVLIVIFCILYPIVSDLAPAASLSTVAVEIILVAAAISPVCAAIPGNWSLKRAYRWRRVNSVLLILSTAAVAATSAAGVLGGGYSAVTIWPILLFPISTLIGATACAGQDAVYARRLLPRKGSDDGRQ